MSDSKLYSDVTLGNDNTVENIKDYIEITTGKSTITELTIDFPWNLYLPRKTMPDKKYSVNLNTMRNLQYFVANQLKQSVKDMFKDDLENYVLLEPIKVDITVYKPTKRKSDKSNQYTIASKYLYDALTYWGTISEDNDDIIWDEHLNRTQLDPEKKGFIRFEFKTVENKS